MEDINCNRNNTTKSNIVQLYLALFSLHKRKHDLNMVRIWGIGNLEYIENDTPLLTSMCDACYACVLCTR